MTSEEKISQPLKRAKVQDEGAEKDRDNEGFVAWLTQNGVEFDASAIDPLATIDNSGSIGVKALYVLRKLGIVLKISNFFILLFFSLSSFYCMFSTNRLTVGGSHTLYIWRKFGLQLYRKDFKNGDVVARIAKAGGTLLSPRTAAANSAIAARALQGGLALSVALWIEREFVGEKSSFAPYLHWLRNAEPVPLRWPAAERQKLLRGTDALALVARDRRALADDFVREAWPTLRIYLGDDALAACDANEQFERFVAAATLVSSRAFGVDAHHGDSMVPFAALFNHSTTQPHVNVQDDERQDLAGDTSNDDAAETVGEARGGGVRDNSLSSRSGATREDDVGSEDGDAFVSDDGSSSTDIDHPSRVTHLRMVCVRECAAGGELLNTYGYHLANRHLLVSTR